MLQHFRDAAERFPQLATDVPYVRIQAAPRTIVTDDELKSLGLIPVYRREDAVLAAYATDRALRPFDSQVDAYAHRQKKLNVLAKIETIRPWTREDRASNRLKKLTIEPNGQYTVDILLLPVEGGERNSQGLAAIERFVTQQGGRVVDRAIEPTFTATRVRLGGQALDSLLDYRDDVALVDLPPTASILVREVLSFDINVSLSPNPHRPPRQPCASLIPAFWKATRCWRMRFSPTGQSRFPGCWALRFRKHQ